MPKRLVRDNSVAKALLLLAVLAGVSVIGLASHNAGDPANDHPSAESRSLGTYGSVSPRLRDSGSIRVFADVYGTEVQAAVDRWNTAMGRAVFQRVTSGTYDLRVRYRVGSECAGFNFNAVYVSQGALNRGQCFVDETGSPLYEHPVDGVVLLSSGFDGLSQETKITGLVHEIGHDLGLDDHYYQPATPACRSDVESIMENWGCSGGSPTPHDVDDVKKAYEIQGKPWVNYIWVSSSTSATLNYDTVNSGTYSVHNEQAQNSSRWRKKSTLEGTVLSSGYQTRSSSTNSYSYGFTQDDGERCFSANGRNWYQSGTEGPDGSEACMNRQGVYFGKVVGTSDTNNDNVRDYFRLFNFTGYGATITNARVTYTNGTFIAWVTEAGQGSGTIRNGQYGSASGLDLPKGAYQFRFNVGATAYTIQLGLDD